MSDEMKVKNQIAEYCNRYAIHPQFAISDVSKIDELRQRKRNVPWPHGDDAGCYAMYDAAMKLLYVGLAGHIARRLNSWFKYNEREDIELPWTSSALGNWRVQPRFLQTIKVNLAYEAPSLEAFLIGTLAPSENVNLRNVPETSTFVDRSFKSS